MQPGHLALQTGVNNMKIKLSAVTLGLMLSSNLLAAEQQPQDTQKHLIGLGSGIVAGTVIAGPLGGIIAGMFGLFVADDVVDEQQLKIAKADISAKNKQLADIQNQIALIKQRDQLQLVSMDREIDKVIQEVESNIQFRTGSYVIEDHYKPQLGLLAESLRSNPLLQLSLAGHADRRGDPSFNQALSEQRVISVKNYLLGQYVEGNQLVTLSYGENAPVSSEQNLESDFFDRRVMLQLKEAKAVMTASN
jgi:peptidoglycan-associated lipoprotein